MKPYVFTVLMRNSVPEGQAYKVTLLNMMIVIINSYFIHGKGNIIIICVNTTSKLWRSQ